MLNMASTPRVLQITSRRLVTYFRHRTVLVQPLSYMTYYQNELHSVQQIPRWKSSGVPMNSQISSQLFLRCFASDHAGMTEKDLSNRVLTVVKLFDKVNPDKVTVEAHFINDLGLDSLDTVEIVMAFEDEFGVEISDEEAEKIFSCKDAIDLLKVKKDVH